MMRSKFIISTFVPALLPAMLLVGCGGETKRTATDSADLTGLWRMSLDSNQNNLSAKSNSSFTLVETADGLSMTDCSARASQNLNKTGNSIEGLPVSPFNIDNNDAMSANDTLGVAKAVKMATAVNFDMGSLTLTSSELGDLSFSDLCISTSNASLLGVTANDNIAATTVLNGQPLLVDIVVMGNLKQGEFDLSKEPGLGQASIRLQSESLKPIFNRTELTLSDGSLSVTEDTVTWSKGSFNGTMPNGNTLSGTFEFEKP